MDKEQFNTFLSGVADELDIPTHIYEDAIVKYEDVGEWLAADDSKLKQYDPVIYTQGSFRLGTAVRPISNRGEYDIDLVCNLTIPKEQVTQKNLKAMVGDRLGQRSDLKEILEPSRRCWRLTFSGQFHMDILPAIPNIERPPTGILLTDTELVRWQKSNPKTYSEWFYNSMRVVFVREKAAFAKSFQGDIEDVPEWQIRTPLQRAVQILKRHRDIHFRNDLENCPVSIILTTLAAKAYKNQLNIVDALFDIIRDMPNFIEYKNDRWQVLNPVEPDENFADKWNEKPSRRNAFFSWLKKAQDDFVQAFQKTNLKEAAETFGRAVGPGEAKKSADSMGVVTFSGLSIPTRSIPQVPELGNIQHAYRLTLPDINIYKVSISGTIYLSRRRKLWELSNRPVPKRVWIKFVAKTNATAPYEVRWQVVNTGKEALEADALRGEFYDTNEDAGSLVRWESTGYAGTHWVEAFVIKDGICVARSGRKYVKVRD